MENLTDNLFKTELINKSKVEEIEPMLSFLFIVHTELEMSEMQKNITPLNDFGVILDYIEEESMQHFFIGKFFKYNIVLAKTSDMGGINVNSVVNVINKAIQIFRPMYIIMPGIAAGLDDNTKIGDVVIADKIIGYESEKIAPTEIIGRYPEFRSPRLFNLFCSANVQNFNCFLKNEIQHEIVQNDSTIQDAPDCDKNCLRDKEKEFSWKDFIVNSCYPKVYTGNYISGEKLLDNSLYRSYLKSRFKEAMALDMEGLGVASASTFNRVYDWLIIKGISDLGDGNKGKNKLLRQIYAMKNVILVLKKVFNYELSFSGSNLKQASVLHRKNVLISGSQCKNGQYEHFTELFLEKLSKQLILNQYNVITGYGLGVGPAVLFGIFEGCDKLKLTPRQYMDRFQTFAFPRINGDDKQYSDKAEKCKIKNREILCANAKIAVFVFGNKSRNGELGEADGMLDELELIAKNKSLILPVGCTGGTARKIYERIVKDVESEQIDFAQSILLELLTIEAKSNLNKFFLMKVYRSLASLYDFINDETEKTKYFTKSINLSKALRADSYYYSLLRQSSMCYPLNDARIMMLSSLKYFTDKNNLVEQAKCCHNLATDAIYLGKYNDCKKYILLSIKYFESYGSKDRASALNTLGIYYALAEANCEYAEKCFLDALNIANSDWVRITVLNNLMTIAIMTRSKDKAKKYLALIEQNYHDGMPVAKVYILFAKAQYHKLNRNVSAALDYFQSINEYKLSEYRHRTLAAMFYNELSSTKIEYAKDNEIINYLNDCHDKNCFWGTIRFWES